MLIKSPNKYRINKYTINLVKILICTFVFILSVIPLMASRLFETELETFKTYNLDMRLKKYDKILRKIGKKRKPHYAESFLAGRLLIKNKKTGKAILWFARSAFKRRKLPGKSHPKYIKAYLQSGVGRALLYPDAIYEIGKLYYRKYGPKTAAEILALLPKKRTDALERRILDMQADIISRYNINIAVQLYKDLLRKKKDPYYYLRIAGYYLAAGKRELALKYYFLVLEHPEVDWTYTASTKVIIKILKRKNSLPRQLSGYQKVKIAEGLRILKKHPTSLSLWKSINVNNLSQKGFYYYIQNYSRLLTSLRQYHKVETILKVYSQKVAQHYQEKIYADVAKRLYKKDAFHVLLRIIPKNGSYKEALSYRLRALGKVGQGGYKDEVRHYMSSFGADSAAAESAYFRICFVFIQTKRWYEAEQCLSELVELTKGAQSGGRSRFFLARVFEKRGKPEAARQLFARVYLNSPSHFLVFEALRRGRVNAPEQLPERYVYWGKSKTENQESYQAYRTWISRNFGNPQAAKLYFQKRAAFKNFGVDPYWVLWEKDLQDIGKGMSNIEKIGSLFIAMGQTSLANVYLDTIQNKRRRYMVGVFAAIKAKDAYLQVLYMNKYLKFEKKNVDILTMTPNAIRCLYPLPYRKDVRRAGKEFNVKEAYVYALMKQESRFHPGLTSFAGARGLMQVMPATARDVNRVLKIKNMNLLNPRHSIMLGVKFFSLMHRRYSGVFEKVAVAYNAGPGRLSRWIREYEFDDIYTFLEQIPLRETYLYVQKTRNFYDRYNVLLKYYY